MARVLFVCFQENTDVIGVKYLDAVLRAEGHDSGILLIPNRDPRNVAGALAHVEAFHPDILGLSAMSYEFQQARAFGLELRKRFPKTPVIMGGIHATTDPVSCLEFCDIAVRGEAEETLVDLLPLLTGRERVLGPGADDDPWSGLDGVAGIVYLRGGRPHYTPVRQPIDDLDRLPSIEHLPQSMQVMHKGAAYPVDDPRIVKKYLRYQGTFLSVVSSRGCPFSCRYCCNSALKSLYGRTKVRPRSVHLVVDEIAREVKKSGRILYVNLQDDCFLMHRTEWLAEFARRYKAEVGIPFVVRTTPRHITREKLALLKDAHLRWVFIGMQTGSDRINREIYGRSVTAEQFRQARTVVAESDVSLWVDVILDNPYETEADHLETIQLLLDIERPYQLDIFSLDYFPGTELYDQVHADGIPVPALGEKSYTEPEPNIINRYIRMSATLPRWWVRWLVRHRHAAFGRAFGMLGYYTCLMVEPFVYIWLIMKSQDFKPGPTWKVIASFYETAFNKLILRKRG